VANAGVESRSATNGGSFATSRRASQFQSAARGPNAEGLPVESMERGVHNTQGLLARAQRKYDSSSQSTRRYRHKRESSNRDRGDLTEHSRTGDYATTKTGQRSRSHLRRQEREAQQEMTKGKQGGMKHAINGKHNNEGGGPSKKT